MSQDLFPLQYFRQQMIHLQSSDLRPRLDFLTNGRTREIHILSMISDYLWQVPEVACFFYNLRIFVYFFMQKIKSCWIEQNW